MINFDYYLEREQVAERLYWLIRLRWLAILGVVVTVSLVKGILKIPLFLFPLSATVVFLTFYNFVFLFLLKKKKRVLKNHSLFLNRIANLQISLDLLSLTLLLHFSGGIENPFIFYFIFHMIISGILLSPRASFFQSSFAIFIFSIMVILEYLGILPHYCLKGFLPVELYRNNLYLGGILFVFITTLYLSSYMAGSISKRLKEREKSLREANLLLEEKDRIKSQYVLRVSHSIKEDLSVISVCLEPVIKGITGALNPQQFDLVERAHQRAEQLMVFVKELLEVTRIKLIKEWKFEYFSLQEIIKEVVGSLSPKIKEKNISLEDNLCSEINKFMGAKEYMREAVYNLLANAIKYTSQGGKIEINLEEREDAFVFQIKDTGIGIPAQEIP
ncbi:MAG: ATP-binding protein, partial [Candidatus Omnitrophica bacterium]|nr:ATP-binding protein [Candidatus Omnitrophota bacterium]